jgi:hypothetical protein
VICGCTSWGDDLFKSILKELYGVVRNHGAIKDGKQQNQNMVNQQRMQQIYRCVYKHKRGSQVSNVWNQLQMIYECTIKMQEAVKNPPEGKKKKKTQKPRHPATSTTNHTKATAPGNKQQERYIRYIGL